MRYLCCENPDCKNVVEWGVRRALYCSKACRQRAYRKRRAERELTVPSRWERCRNCGVPFVAHGRYHTFCKASCRVSHWQQMKRLELKGAAQ